MFSKILNKDICKFELKRNLKTWLIWFLALTIICVVFMLLFIIIEKMNFDFNEIYEQMGLGGYAYIGLNYSVGFFANEIAMFIQVAGAIYVALFAIKLLAGEESDKTAEVLLSNPIERRKVWTSKLLVLFTYTTAYIIGLALVNYLLVIALEGSGSVANTSGDYAGLWLTFLMTYIMLLSVASVSYFLSAHFSKGGTGIAMAVALGTYVLFMFYSIGSSAIKNNILKNIFRIFQFLSPYSFCDANVTIGYLGHNKLIDAREFWMTMIGILVWVGLSIAALILSYKKYNKKDIL